MRKETEAIHAAMKISGKDPDIVPSLHRSTVYEIDKTGHHEADWHYTRLDNPNRKQWEHVLAVMEEGASAAAFSSGVAAASAVFQSLEPGDHIIIPDDVYSGNREMVKEIMVSWGLQAELLDTTESAKVEKLIAEQSRLIWVESPSCPVMTIMEIDAISDLAHSTGAIVCVDYTWPTPINQLPLKLRADLLLHSTTKYFGG